MRWIRLSERLGFLCFILITFLHNHCLCQWKFLLCQCILVSKSYAFKCSNKRQVWTNKFVFYWRIIHSTDRYELLRIPQNNHEMMSLDRSIEHVMFNVRSEIDSLSIQVNFFLYWILQSIIFRVLKLLLYSMVSKSV